MDKELIAKHTSFTKLETGDTLTVKGEFTLSGYVILTKQEIKELPAAVKNAQEYLKQELLYTLYNGERREFLEAVMELSMCLPWDDSFRIARDKVLLAAAKLAPAL